MRAGKGQTSGARIEAHAELAKAVRERREAEGMKQVTLAALAGVTERTVQRLEAGQRVDERTVQRIAGVLGLDRSPFLADAPSFDQTAPLQGDQVRKTVIKSYFEEMTRFDRWANERLLAWMESREENAELTRVFAHLLAENLPWLHLLRGEVVPEGLDPEPDWSLAECRENFAPTMDAFAAYVAELSDEEFAALVRSHSPAGRTFENTVLEVLTNLLAHAEHHRGQIVAAISRQSGEYVPTLYMSYLRCRP